MDTIFYFINVCHESGAKVMFFDDFCSSKIMFFMMSKHFTHK